MKLVKLTSRKPLIRFPLVTPASICGGRGPTKVMAKLDQQPKPAAEPQSANANGPKRGRPATGLMATGLVVKAGSGDL